MTCLCTPEQLLLHSARVTRGGHDNQEAVHLSRQVALLRLGLDLSYPYQHLQPSPWRPIT